METGNVLDGIPESLPKELTEVLAANPQVRIERIVSKGHATPEGDWYDQEEHEWVLLLKGAARLRFDDGEVTSLQPGDFLNIPAHRRHRVEWTASGGPTVWLAVFCKQ